MPIEKRPLKLILLDSVLLSPAVKQKTHKNKCE